MKYLPYFTINSFPGLAGHQLAKVLQSVPPTPALRQLGAGP